MIPLTELDKAIATAYNNQGKQEDINRVYLTLLQSTLFVPVEKSPINNLPEGEPFKPLIGVIADNFFLVSFDSLERLQGWAGDQIEQIAYVELTGKEVIAGLGEAVYFGLNPSTPFYKEFSPDEIKRLKTIVSRIEQLRG